MTWKFSNLLKRRVSIWLTTNMAWAIDFLFKNSLIIGTNSLSSSNRSRKGMIKHKKWSFSFKTGLAITFDKEFTASPDPILWQVLTSTKGNRVRNNTTIRQPHKHITNKRNVTSRFLLKSLIFAHVFLLDWLSMYYWFHFSWFFQVSSLEP